MSKQWRIIDLITWAETYFKDKGFENPRNEIECLIRSVLSISRIDVYLNFDRLLSLKEIKKIKSFVNRRLKKEPLQYITESCEFYGREYFVNNNVLIPRPETETLIDLALENLKGLSSPKILDIGTGSGCILLSILKEKKDFYGTGIDISNKCIEISKINASKLNLSSRVKFFKSNVDNFFYGKYDLIISNPPYIKKLELKYLDKDVVDFEPKLALDGGLEGLSEIKKVIVKTSELIKKNGLLILEIGFDQKNKVKKILIENGFYINKVVKDLAKNDRCIVSTKK